MSDNGALLPRPCRGLDAEPSDRREKPAGGHALAMHAGGHAEPSGLAGTAAALCGHGWWPPSPPVSRRDTPPRTPRSPPVSRRSLIYGPRTTPATDTADVPLLAVTVGCVSDRRAGLPPA